MSYEKENQTTSPEVVKEFPVCVCVFGVYLCVRKKVCVSLFLFYFPFILSESRFISVLHFQYLCLWFVVTETTCTHTVLDFCFRCITVKVHTHTHTHTVDRVCVGVMQWSQCTISCSSQPGMKPHHRPCGCSEDTHTHTNKYFLKYFYFIVSFKNCNTFVQFCSLC